MLRSSNTYLGALKAVWAAVVGNRQVNSDVDRLRRDGVVVFIDVAVVHRHVRVVVPADWRKKVAVHVIAAVLDHTRPLDRRVRRQHVVSMVLLTGAAGAEPARNRRCRHDRAHVRRCGARARRARCARCVCRRGLRRGLGVALACKLKLLGRLLVAPMTGPDGDWLVCGQQQKPRVARSQVLVAEQVGEYGPSTAFRGLLELCHVALAGRRARLVAGRAVLCAANDALAADDADIVGP